MLKVTNEVKTYDETAMLLHGSNSNNDPVFVRSNCVDSEMVVIEFYGKSVTVLADDMIRAINNAMNKGR